MNVLLNSLTKFINTIIDLYPLPKDLTSDLQTLNAYLKSYTPQEQHLLESFVNHQVEKLAFRTKKITQKDSSNFLSVKDQIEAPKRQKENVKYPQLKFDFKLKIPSEPTEEELSSSQSFFEKSHRPLSHRTGKSRESDGIKSARHKFGTRDKQKIQKGVSRQANKENLSLTANINLRGLQQQKSEQKSLKVIKSEAELLHKNFSQVSLNRQNSHENNRQYSNKPRPRPESTQNKQLPSISSLKIKLKAKPSIDIDKVKEGIDTLLKQIYQEDAQIDELVTLLDLEPENTCFV